jgi:hypothetical protein
MSLDNFILLSEITELETIATGTGIREIALLNKSTVRDDGASAKDLQQSNLLMVQFILLKFIFTKLMESESAK